MLRTGTRPDRDEVAMADCGTVNRFALVRLHLLSIHSLFAISVSVCTSIHGADN